LNNFKLLNSNSNFAPYYRFEISSKRILVCTIKAFKNKLIDKAYLNNNIEIEASILRSQKLNWIEEKMQKKFVICKETFGEMFKENFKTLMRDLNWCSTIKEANLFYKETKEKLKITNMNISKYLIKYENKQDILEKLKESAFES